MIGALALLLLGCSANDPTVAITEGTAATGTAPGTTTTAVAVSGETVAAAVPTSVRPGSSAPVPASPTAGEPVRLPPLGDDAWWIPDVERPDEVVRTDASGSVMAVLWTQRSVERGFAGSTMVCQEVDGVVRPVDLIWSFEGPLRDTYEERREFEGRVLSERSMAVDGTNLPPEVNQVCGEGLLRVLVTPMQLTALLTLAGFTDIEGDHAIDPTWAALATWQGVAYPFFVSQGDFVPDPDPASELLECSIGRLRVAADLPAPARERLAGLADCA